MKRAIIYARVSSKRQADDGLPVLGSLRTVRLTIVRPARFTVAKQDVLLTMAA